METRSFWISNASVPPPPSLAFALLIKHENPRPHVIPGLACSLSAFLISKLLLSHPFVRGGVSTEPLSLGGDCDVRVFKVTELGFPPHRAKLLRRLLHLQDQRVLSEILGLASGKCSRTESSFSSETISKAGLTLWGRGNERISGPALSIVPLGCPGGGAEFISGLLELSEEFEPLALCQYWGAAVCVHNSRAKEAETGGLSEHVGQSSQLVSPPAWFGEEPQNKQ